MRPGRAGSGNEGGRAGPQFSNHFTPPATPSPPQSEHGHENGDDERSITAHGRECLDGWNDAKPKTLLFSGFRTERLTLSTTTSLLPPCSIIRSSNISFSSLAYFANFPSAIQGSVTHFTPADRGVSSYT
ncbi:uncharacterized protein MYCFIDRAFT_170848 [Pseudocercospora fijiensis CIRAD86]|uniref:Uncharacterized protein n=1 Tax=Pseudocercospora fijiensis (strain CIRAD86) TaxID=383855 RepID=N1Q937_PSEFD|nr:uncharacterized protein MYCFIDRAFT_170848 [Pseudocercospora fijiensis CIRAD86]EME89389.1 hypothetical protein MYCFIDRAFT_170848 [Pseudocercospora fijiensis CIRAD86]